MGLSVRVDLLVLVDRALVALVVEDRVQVAPVAVAT